MPATYEPIVTTTLGTAAANITFSSISTAYTDLRLIATILPAAGGTDLRMTINGDTTSIYSSVYLNGNGSAASAARTGSGNPQTNLTTGAWLSSSFLGFLDLNIFQYNNATTRKMYLCNFASDQNGGGQVQLSAGYLNTTSAISSLSIFLSGSSNLAAGTKATLFGIKAA